MSEAACIANPGNKGHGERMVGIGGHYESWAGYWEFVETRRAEDELDVAV